MTDPIADMLTRIRNAVRVKKTEVEIPFSKLKLEIAKRMTEAGFLAAVDEHPEERILLVRLRYADGQPPLSDLVRVSRPGRRVYVGKEALPRVQNDFGIAILSTPRGILTNRQARKMGVGGEVICHIFV